MGVVSDPEVQALPIGGEPVQTGEQHEIRSPYSGEVVGVVAWAGPEHACRSVEAATAALSKGWSRPERARLIERMAQLVADNVEEIARTICAEAGKPISLARVEAERAVGTWEAAAYAARALTGRQVALDAWESGAGYRAYTVRHPIGVVAAITPFNFPFNLVCHKVAPAIAAGCPVVLKPADKTPLSSLLLARLLAEAGLPAGWLNVVVGDAEQIADVLLSDARVRMLTFTGSSHVGHLLKQKALHAKVTLELGNATPVILHSDAEIGRAVSKVVPPAFAFAGQACVSPQRLLVHRTVADDVRQAVVDEVGSIVAGDPADESVMVGPLITGAAHDRVLDWIQTATATGAKVLTGGTSLGKGVVAPTVLDQVERGAQIACEEVFGPVLGIIEYETLDEAIEIANDTPYGLQAGIFTESITTAQIAGDRLRFGTVMINESGSFRADPMPYGGTKDSGNTKEGPLYAAQEMTEERLVVIASSDSGNA